jgi:hypothetical protein
MGGWLVAVMFARASWQQGKIINDREKRTLSRKHDLFKKRIVAAHGLSKKSVSSRQ